MSDDGYMTQEEFTKLYGRDLARKELVTLLEHDGERMWQRQSDGWYRLSDKPGVAGGQ